jgi:hypothetical protein
MRPVALQIGTGDFALAAGRRRIPISLSAGTLNPPCSRDFISICLIACSVIHRTDAGI